jgi:hypothetical protein
MYSGQDAVFPTQLYLMKEFNMGVSLQKWDGNSFNPIFTAVQYKPNDGGTTLSGGGRVITSPYSSIDIGAGCGN